MDAVHQLLTQPGLLLDVRHHGPPLQDVLDGDGSDLGGSVSHGLPVPSKLAYLAFLGLQTWDWVPGAVVCQEHFFSRAVDQLH